MSVGSTAAAAATQLSDILTRIEERPVDELINAIYQAKKLFFAGAGRSMLILRCIAMRMMHLGFESYVVGDTTTPAFEVNDLIIFGSGSGETSGLINIAKRVRSLGGKMAVITTRKSATLGQLSDICIEIPAYPDHVGDSDLQAVIFPGGSIFEQSMLLLGDSIVLPLAIRQGVPLDRKFDRHANLE